MYPGVGPMPLGMGSPGGGMPMAGLPMTGQPGMGSLGGVGMPPAMGGMQLPDARGMGGPSGLDLSILGGAPAHMDQPAKLASMLQGPGAGSPLTTPDGHSAFLQDIGKDSLHSPDMSMPDSHSNFLFGAEPGHDLLGSGAAAAHGHAPLDMGTSTSRPTSFLFGDGVTSPLASAHGAAVDNHHHHPEIVQSGLMQVGTVATGLESLQMLKKAVLLTGGLCSKMFGIAIVGFLAFQSMQANIKAQESRERERERAIHYGYEPPR